MQVFFIDETVTPYSKYPSAHYLNTDVELAFTSKRGIIATLEFSSFRVETDVSVLPFEQTDV